ncbi:tannase and feruloyl esterase [Apiospora kogelbergensis]|uniref:Carboxylic ester hydrolase n=1 Tax=Apiospora kogelbergensis TaxID=1337665 RepID=A0AAW0R0T6_9PEZI
MPSSLSIFSALGLFSLCRALNLCPGVPPTGNCNENRFQSILQKYNATIETINSTIASLGTGCFGEDISNNIFYGYCPTAQVSERGFPACNYAEFLPPSCAVIVKMDSYRFGLIMPEEQNYTGSFMATGGFSFAGGINWREMWAGAYYYGMAVMSTDQGHRGEQPDLRWAKDNPRARDDWGYRALNGSIPVAKDFITAYYGKNISHSYFAGCSTSGRQGLKQLEIDPTSFDGLLIGAPALDQEHLMPWVAKLADIDPPDTERTVPDSPSQRQFIVDGVRRGCDAKDGVVDDVIMNTTACNIADVAATLGCNVNHNPLCLTQAQINTLVELHQNYTVNTNGTTRDVYPGPEPGAEDNLFVFVDPSPGPYAAAAKPFGFDWQWPIDFLNGYGYGYNYTDKIVSDAESQRPGMPSPRVNNTKWADFHHRGGKVMMYHGLADGTIPTKSSAVYFDAVKEVASDRDDFMLYYQVPGMHHCFFSDSLDANQNPLTPQYTNTAPWYFSGATQGSAALAYTEKVKQLVTNASSDMFTALINWVEHPEEKPHGIVATTFHVVPQSPGYYAQRPVCPYPQVAEYDGTGVTNLTTSWKCP